MRRSHAILMACTIALLAGCGDSRTPAPSLTRPATGGGLRMLRFAAQGVSFTAPRSWTVIAVSPPMVTMLGSGRAVVALWRYPPPRGLRTTADQLQLARAALIAAARVRDPSLELIGSRVLRVNGIPALELDAVERIAGQRRRSHSTHLFTGQAEIVLDEYAPVALFARVDQAVFSPLARSLRVAVSR